MKQIFFHKMHSSNPQDVYNAARRVSKPVAGETSRTLEALTTILNNELLTEALRKEDLTDGEDSIQKGAY